MILSILGGIITLITGIVLNHYDTQFKIELEEKKFQSSLLLKATDEETYESFSDMLVALQENGLLSLDSTQVAKLRKKKFVSANTPKEVTKDSASAATVPIAPKMIQEENGYVWTVITGADTKLEAAEYEKNKAVNKGFSDVSIWLRKNSYRTCIGKYTSREEALNVLFDAKEKLNNTSYIVQLENWCPNAIWDKEKQIYICP